MKKIIIIFLSYLLITFNSFVLAVEKNNSNVLKIGILAPFSGDDGTIPYSGAGSCTYQQTVSENHILCTNN